MSWATRRRFIILCIIGAVVIAFLATVAIAAFYKTPSCTDGVQNQGETGIDCGGACAYLCTAEVRPPTVLFTQAIRNGAGRIDVIALVENKNVGVAAQDVPYSITLYGADQSLIQRVSGVLDLPPSARVPVFMPGVASGNQTVANAFLEIRSDSSKWFSLPIDPRVIPVVSAPEPRGTPGAPRVEAILTNPGVVPLTNVRAIVFVHNDKGDVIAASATVVPSIPAQGRAVATFTWNDPFPSAPARIEVIPIISFP